jgi:hypothetical protein
MERARNENGCLCERCCIADYVEESLQRNSAAAHLTPDIGPSTRGWNATREEGEPVNEAASNAQ